MGNTLFQFLRFFINGLQFRAVQCSDVNPNPDPWSPREQNGPGFDPKKYQIFKTFFSITIFQCSSKWLLYEVIIYMCLDKSVIYTLNMICWWILSFSMWISLDFWLIFCYSDPGDQNDTDPDLRHWFLIIKIVFIWIHFV